MGIRSVLLAALVASATTNDVPIPATMRAAVATSLAHNEGDISNVRLVPDQPVPRPGLQQVLIRVVASSVNPIDWKVLSNPLLKFPHVLGFDLAGTVVAVGSWCSRLKVGDEVWADLGKAKLLKGVQMGAWAEFAVADESQVGLKPRSLDFQSAASLPLVSLTDLQALRQTGAPWNSPNFTVVVTSGAGGTGIPAVQLSRALGASFVATAASPNHISALKSLGADLVVDYHKTTLWEALPENSVDVVYDNYGAPGTADLAMKVLKPGGVFIFLPGKSGEISKHPKPGVRQINYGLCDSSKHEDLDFLAGLVDAGKLRAVVSETYDLEDYAQAFNASLTNHAFGKIGINVASQKLATVLVQA